MKNIRTLLEKWKKNAAPDHDLRARFAIAIQKHTKVIILPAQVAFAHGIAFVKASSLAKTEIFIKKAKILEDLQTSLGDDAPKDIK